MRILKPLSLWLLCMVAHSTAHCSTPTSNGDAERHYEGQLQQGQMMGQAQLTTSDYLFKGEFAYGKAIRGAFYFFNESVLLAERIVTEPKRIVIEGQLQNPQFSYLTKGQFEMDYVRVENGSIPTGQPRAFNQQTRVYPDGSELIAQFVDDFPRGQALRIDANGFDQYEYWQAGELEYASPGPESLAFRQSSQVCGFPSPYSQWAWYGYDCQNGQLNGEGIAYSPDGKHIFSGTVVQNQWQNGSLSLDNGKQLTGSWQAFKLEGDGSEIQDDQLVYRGPFRRGQRHGTGTCQQNKGFVECKFFRGKPLTTQAQMIDQQRARTEQLTASAKRIERQQIAELKQQQRSRSALWKQRHYRLEENESVRKRQVAQNIQLYQNAYATLDRTLAEMQQITQETNTFIRDAFAQQEAENERKRQAYLRKKAEYEAAQRQREAERTLAEAQRRQAESERLAQIEQARKDQLAQRQAECESEGHTWLSDFERCNRPYEIVIGVTCFDEQGRPRGCTVAEAKAKQAQQNQASSRQNTGTDFLGSRPAPVIIAHRTNGTSTESGDQTQSTPPSSDAANDDVQSDQPARSKRIKNDIVRVEAIAYCDSDKKQRWWCHGPIQRLILWQDDKAEALSAVGCQNTDEARRVPFQHQDRKNPGWIYFCEYGINSYDADVAKKYDVPGAILQRRNSYRCREYSVATCKTLYRRQDGSRPNEEIIPRDTP